MDKAFSFYYPDSLDLLTAWGAEIVPFSPLHDSALPEQVGGVYLGGGFPELYAQGLSENTGMRLSLRRAAEMGQPIYAECGGLMYLSEGMEDMSDNYYPMVGIVPRRCYLKGSPLSLGYRTVRAVADNPLLCAGESVRGHEFHLSSLQEPSPGSPSWSTAYEVLEQPGRVEGFRYRNVLASYIHLHLGSKAGLASRFVESCVRWAAQERDE
jgi:cobyrinic acid a,c-diamide synthase